MEQGLSDCDCRCKSILEKTKASQVVTDGMGRQSKRCVFGGSRAIK
jgi:hypothetical protein